MLKLEMQLALTPEHSGGSIRGWFLPSRNPSDWVAALHATRFRRRHRLFIAPTSISDISASGLICLSEPLDRSHSGNPLAEERHVEHKFMVPLGAIGLRGFRSDTGSTELWVPVNAKLVPQISPQQLLAEHFASVTQTLVWLPSTGLIALEADDAIAATQLLQPVSIQPTAPDITWNAGSSSEGHDLRNNQPDSASSTRRKSLQHFRWEALPDRVQLPSRITGILLPPAVQFDAMFQQEQEEIGNQQSELSKLGNDGQSHRSLLEKISTSINDAIRKWLQRKAERERERADAAKKRDPKRYGAGMESGANAAAANAKAAGNRKGGLQQWISSNVMQYFAGRLKAERERQIQKLLDMINKDPDKGLRFAIPLAAMSALRGFAMPGSKLFEQLPDFSLGNLFGSGPGDVWDFDAKLHQRLQAAYREQANRELAAGRYRRAAYIHAHLLGDLLSAAKILETGMYYTEAAVIYGEKLNRPRDQARCLGLSGQTGEAAKIYEQNGEFEEAALLWEAAGDNERAKATYERAIDLYVKKRQYVEAAHLIDRKLDDRPRAEALLWSEWPWGPTAGLCASLAFKWMAESGRHDEARARLASLEGETPIAYQLRLAQLTAELAHDYPDAQVRSEAEDSCRLAAVKGIRTISRTEAEDRLKLIRGLDVQDRILSRDTHRFEKLLQAAATQPTEKLRRVKRPRVITAYDFQPLISTLPSLHLPANLDYLSARMVANELCLLARKNQNLFCVRASDLVEGPCKTNSTLVFDQLPAGEAKLWMVHQYANEKTFIEIFLPSEPKQFAATIPSPSTGAVWHLLMRHENILCCDAGEDGALWKLDQDGELLRQQLGSSVSTYEFRRPLSELARTLPVELNARLVLSQNRPYVICQGYVLSYSNQEMNLVTTLAGFPNAVEVSLPHTQPRLAIAGDDGLRIVSTNDDKVEVVCDAGLYTHVTFMHGGRLIAANRKELRCFQKTSTAMKLIERVPLQTGELLALLPLSATVLGVLYADGVLERFTIGKV